MALNCLRALIIGFLMLSVMNSMLAKQRQAQHARVREGASYTF
jgi:hypothetical protein